MLSHFEKKNEQITISSKDEELIKFKEVIKEMQKRIVAKKSEKYNFDFEEGSLTTIKQRQSEIFLDEEKKESGVKTVVETKIINAPGGGIVNKYKEKLQSMLGKKIPRPLPVK
jgi:hypothetical protein